MKIIIDAINAKAKTIGTIYGIINPIIVEVSLLP